MSAEDIARRTIVLEIPGMADVAVARDVPYADGLVMDVYQPAARPATVGSPASPVEEVLGRASRRAPVVVFACGFADPRFGARFREMGAYTSWGRLLAASGLAAIAYGYREPRADLATLLAHLRGGGGEALGLDGGRLALWAASGNVPLALASLMDEAPGAFRCAALLYGYMLEGEEVAGAAQAYNFLTPAAGRSVADLPPSTPLFVARAGKDRPGLNASLDAFVGAALARNLPLSFTNHPDGPHAFDLFDDSETSRHAIRATVAFLRAHLLGA